VGPEAEAQTGAAEEASGASRRRPKGGLGGLPQSGKKRPRDCPRPRGEADGGAGAWKPAPGVGPRGRPPGSGWGGWGRLWRAEGKGAGSAEYPDRTDE